MEKYKSNKKIEIKESTFSVLRNFFRTYNETEKRFFEVANEIKKLKNQESIGELEESEEYKQLSLELNRLDKRLGIMDKRKDNLKKEFMKIGTIALGTVLAITGTIAGISYGIQSNRENRVMEALSMQGTKVENFYKESPNELKELAQSPKEVTQLALDTLKANLANHYGVPNKNDFEVLYKTETPDRQPVDTRQTYSISYKGEIVCAHISRTDSTGGNTTIDEDTMPNEIRKAIDAIATAQRDPENSFKAYKALDASKDDKTLKDIETRLPNYLPNEQDKDIGR